MESGTFRIETRPVYEPIDPPPGRDREAERIVLDRIVERMADAAERMMTDAIEGVVEGEYRVIDDPDQGPYPPPGSPHPPEPPRLEAPKGETA